MAYIYRHIRHDKNEPFYIGVSISEDNYKRAYNKCRRNALWKKIVNKTDYTVEILLDNLSEDILYMKEEEFINLYGMIYNKTGSLANLTLGGKGTKGSKHNLGRKWNQESKLKLSESKKNMSEETKLKMSLAHTGKKVSKETREKQSIARQGYKCTETSKINMSIAQSKISRKGRQDSYKKKIDEYDLDMNFIKTHESLFELRLSGFNPSNVCACCKGRRANHKSSIFKYNINSPSTIQP